MPVKITQKPNGKYLLAVSSSADGLQKWFYRTVDAATKKEAEREWTAFAAETQSKVGKQYLHMANISLDDFRHFRNTQTGRKISAKTLNTEDYLYSYIRPAIGSVPMRKIKPYHITHVMSEVARDDIGTRNQPLSAETQAKIFKLMKRLFSDAYGLEIIPSNPFNSPILKPPRVEHKGKIIYNDVELCAFVKALHAEDVPLMRRTQVLLLIGVGLRREELLGLQPYDFSQEYTTVTIQRAIIKRFKHEPLDPLTRTSVRTATLKTSSAYRTTDVPSVVGAVVKQYRVQSDHKLPWLFDEHPDSLWQWLDRFCERHGFRHISPHVLRHMHITYKHYAGLPIADISKDAGHSSKEFTMRQYVGTIEKSNRAGADVLDQKLNII